MNSFLSGIGAHLAQHVEACVTACIALVLATAKTMPVAIPKSAQELWTWMRDSVQTALPISRATPSQPAGPAQPKQ